MIEYPSHLSKEEYEVLENLINVTKAKTSVTNAILSKATGVPAEDLLLILHTLRRKKMVMYDKDSRAYASTSKGRAVIAGNYVYADKRYKKTFGICGSCKTCGVLTYFRKQYVCDGCMLADQNPLKLENYIYSGESTYPESVSNHNTRIRHRRKK